VRETWSEATFDLRYSFSRDSGFVIFTEMDFWSLQFRVAYNNYKKDGLQHRGLQGDSRL
jgi:hypothetical protein